MTPGKLYRWKGGNAPLYNDTDTIVSWLDKKDILIFISVQERPSTNNTLVKVVHQDVVGCIKFIGFEIAKFESTWFEEALSD